MKKIMVAIITVVMASVVMVSGPEKAFAAESYKRDIIVYDTTDYNRIVNVITSDYAKMVKMDGNYTLISQKANFDGEVMRWRVNVVEKDTGEHLTAFVTYNPKEMIEAYVALKNGLNNANDVQE